MGRLYNYSDNFEWHVGRVDDRFYETGYEKIIDEVDILKEFLNLNINDAFTHLSILKATYPLCKKLDILGNQVEMKGIFNYCWSSSVSDYVFYIDRSLFVYRCPCTVGREEYNIGRFSEGFLNNYKLRGYSYLDFDRCKNCPIGGYCSGGCFLSRQKDWDYFCKQEICTFNKFIDSIVIERILKLLRVKDE